MARGEPPDQLDSMRGTPPPDSRRPVFEDHPKSYSRKRAATAVFLLSGLDVHRYLQKVTPQQDTGMAPHVGRRVLALQFLRKIVLAPTAIGFSVYFLASWFGVSYTPLLVLCGITVGWPIKFSLGVRYDGWRRTRRARALGVVPASESRGKLFWDIDLVQELQELDKNGFVGEFLSV